MTKRTTHHPDDDENDEEMTTIRSHLNQQDQTLKEILTVLRGSVSMGVDGVLAKLKQVEIAQDQLISDVAHLQRWQKMVRESKGQITITLSQLFTRILAVIGGIGTLVGVMLGIKQLIDNSQ